MHTDYIIAAAASTARATEATTARAGAASDWIVGAGVGASVDDPESDSATGSVPRALLVLLLPGLLALGLL